MIAAVRIRGQVDVGQNTRRTLDNLKLRKKFQCVVYEENDSIKGMMNKAKDYIAYGEISDETVEKLAEKKGSDVESGDVISLRPPTKGLKSTRKQVGQGGSLGKHDDMDDLLGRMV